mgnify:FL=1
MPQMPRRTPLTVQFRTPFSAAYWKTAAREAECLPMLVMTALFIAMRLALSGVRIPVGDNLFVYVSFLISTVGSMVYGPVLALASGFASDLLSFFLVSDGSAFFFGYTLSTMLGALISALFLYRTRITVLRIALTRLCVDLFVNVLLGALWSSMLYSKGYYYYLAKSIVKNAIMLPIEIVLLVLVLQLLVPIAARIPVISPQKTKRIPWF